MSFKELPGFTASLLVTLLRLLSPRGCQRAVPRGQLGPLLKPGGEVNVSYEPEILRLARGVGLRSMSQLTRVKDGVLTPSGTNSIVRAL
jgi:hypothetical protein